MSLRIRGWRNITKWAIIGVLTILFLVFLIRVATFEAGYYASKEGTERAVAEQNDDEELDETKPTDDQIKEYTVAPDRPRYLTIEKIGVSKSRVRPMGLTMSGELDTPNNIFDVGWYEASGKPGQGGTMVIDGHNGGPHVHGVFKKTPDLVEGDIVEVERGDGKKFKYKVVENVAVDLNEADKYMAVAMKSPEYGKESVTLITCTGDWSQQQGTYLSRQFTRAILVDE